MLFQRLMHIPLLWGELKGFQQNCALSALYTSLGLLVLLLHWRMMEARHCRTSEGLLFLVWMTRLLTWSKRETTNDLLMPRSFKGMFFPHSDKADQRIDHYIMFKKKGRKRGSSWGCQRLVFCAEPWLITASRISLSAVFILRENKYFVSMLIEKLNGEVKEAN